MKTIPQHTVHNDINTRMNLRIQPNEMLQPNFDPRAVPTRRVFQPIHNSRTPYSTELQNHLAYTPESNFNPGSTRAPVNGFLNAIGKESELKNLNTKLTSNQSNIYIPSSTSDLYNTTVVGSQSVQPHPNLFQQFSFERKDLFHPEIGNQTFNNSTRSQLRALGK